MTDQPSNTDDEEEPLRFKVTNPSMDEYLEYDPETNAYYAPGTPSTYDAEGWRREFEKIKQEGHSGGLISVDDLRAAGVFDVPPSWRKSLGRIPVERDLFSDLVDDDDSPPAEEASAPDDPQCEGPADESR